MSGQAHPHPYIAHVNQAVLPSYDRRPLLDRIVFVAYGRAARTAYQAMGLTINE